MGIGLLQVNDAHFITDNSIKLNEEINHISFFLIEMYFVNTLDLDLNIKVKIILIHPDSGSTAKFGKNQLCYFKRW